MTHSAGRTVGWASLTTIRYALRRIPGTERLLLIFNHSKYEPEHHHQGQRTPLAAAVSDDRGKTWRILGTLLAGPYEYNNPDGFFTSRGTAVVTVQYNRTPFERTRINLRAIIMERLGFFLGNLMKIERPA